MLVVSDWHLNDHHLSRFISFCGRSQSISCSLLFILSVCPHIIGPTALPSTEPTLDASRYTECALIDLDIIDFDAFSAADLGEDSVKQTEIAELTKDAVAQSAFSQDNSLNFKSFIVSHDNVTGDVSNVNGIQRSLFIVQQLCAADSHDLDSLTFIVEAENSNITAIIMSGLVELYMDGDVGDSFQVSISISSDSEFSNYFLSTNYHMSHSKEN